MIPFTGNPLNRLGEKRAEAAFVANRLRGADCLILPFFQGMPLCGDGPRPAFLTPDQCGLRDGDDATFLGDWAARPIFAHAIDDAARAESLSAFGTFQDLRRIAPLLPQEELAVASQGRGMVEWQARSKFCGRCGAPARLVDGGHKRVCAGCGAEEFPRLDPAVIMLAICDDRCLLARNTNWTDLFSTLAGFVEPGESLEEAVARELSEEAGVKAVRIRYFASQPWPFPAALMLGFFAEVEDTDLTLDATEIAEAHWFTKAEALALLDGSLPGRRGPSPAAIARFLIREWAGQI